MTTPEIILAILQLALLAPLCVLGLHKAWMILLFLRRRRAAPAVEAEPAAAPLPRVTIQLPLYNERFVVGRLLDAVAAIDYPRDRLEVQVLDDSTDDTPAIVADKLRQLPADLRTHHVRRADRIGYKAGALAHGLGTATGELIAVFDADFVPARDFLARTVPEFRDERVGLVQARWGHTNREHCTLTEMQALLLDGHFAIEQRARATNGCFFNFNGTAGIFRRRCIEDAGGWQHDTLTEDMDLSYRAQLRGWKFRYLPDLSCPAELPRDMNGFLTQQHRWAKGSIQTGRKLMGRILAAPLPVLTKVESVFHLFGNLAFPLLFVLILVSMPLHLLRFANHSAVPPSLAFVEAMPLILATLSVFAYYGLSQWLLHRLSPATLLRLPLVLALGAGACLNNTLAVLGGCRGEPGEFRRTPKFDRDPVTKPGPTYHSPRGVLPLVELLLAAWAGTTFALTALQGLWSSALFHGLFAVGFLWVGLRSWSGNRRYRSLLPVALLASCSGSGGDPPIVSGDREPEIVACRAIIGEEFGRTDIVYASHNGLGFDDLPPRSGMETGVRVHPDGNRLVFARERQKDRETSREIFLGSLDNSVLDVRLTANIHTDDGPCWSPDGAALLFSSDRGGSRDLWRMDADGENPTPLTSGPADDRDPDWHTAGIVFSRREGSGPAKLFVMDSSGKNLRQLTDGGAGTGDYEPAFAPDGKGVLFVRELAAGQQVLMLSTPASPVPVVIGDGTGEDRFPRWSPHGDRIFVARRRPLLGIEGPRLFAMFPDGSNPVMVFPDQRFVYLGCDALPAMRGYRPVETADVTADVSTGDLTMRLGVVGSGTADSVLAKDGAVLKIRAQTFGLRRAAGVLLTLPLPVEDPHRIAWVSIQVTAGLSRADPDSFLRLAVRNFLLARYDSAVELSPPDTGLRTLGFDFASLAHVDANGGISLEVIGDLSGSDPGELDIDHIQVKLRLHAPE